VKTENYDGYKNREDKASFTFILITDGS